MLPFLDIVGDVPEKPGFCIPKPSFGFGFLRLERRGERVMEDATVESFVEPIVVEVVFMEAILPLEAVTYGFPLASVIETPPPGNNLKLNLYKKCCSVRQKSEK